MHFDTSQAVYYHEGEFPPKSLDLARLIPAMLEATDALARYDEAIKTMHNSEIFLAPLRKQEAVVSSRMEGTISTMDEILELDADFDPDNTANTDRRSDAVETILYARALSTAQQQMNDGWPLGASLVKSIHQHLLSVGRGAVKTPGSYKTEPNFIGDEGTGVIHFVPIAPEKLESGMDAMFAIMSDKSLPPIIRAALFHLEFEALHPFKDGNGRVGRVLITLMLWAEGVISAPHFYISRFFEDHKADYIRHMRNVSENGDWETWCEFFLKAIAQQANTNLATANRIRTLYDEMKGRFAELLGSRHCIAALDYVFTYPIFYNSAFTKNAGIPLQTANRLSTLLQNAGLLEIVRPAAGSRSAILRLEPLMKLVRI